MGFSFSNSDLIVAIVAGIVVLLIERIWTGVSEKIKEKRIEKYTRSFLRDWHNGAMKFLNLEEVDKTNTLEEWNEYLSQLRSSPKSNSISPSLPYRRTDLPDVSSIITESLPNMPDGDI